MEAAGEGNDARAAGGGPRDLDGVLDRLGPGGEEHRLGRPLERRRRVQPLGQPDIGFVGHDLEGGMSEPLRLLGHGRHHLGMAVTGVQHGDAAGEVDIAPALDVPDLGILGARGIDRGGVADAARDGGIAAGEQLGIGGHRLASVCLFLGRPGATPGDQAVASALAGRAVLAAARARAAAPKAANRRRDQGFSSTCHSGCHCTASAKPGARAR